ncbi:NAD(P)-binding protein [Parathielavia appendiculata]|uniref:NAD(P)-binding protein n=1 Tax=Parathielavia appendiculata TaxID=2587402 RepID=A0AAN6TV78_9PEZI|nr:NAD(P)-binding protein [Parathielavia appendiculata]
MTPIMMYSGVCHTDLLLQQGGLAPFLDFPAIARHEGAGGYILRVGDHALLSFAACGDCGSCRDDKFSSCSSFPSLNLSGICRADGSSPAKLSDGRPVRSHFFGQSSHSRMSVVHETCVTGAGTILNFLNPRSDQTVAVFGAGSVGFAAILAAAGILIRQIGSLAAEVKNATGGLGVDFAVDTTGVSAVVEQMLDCLAYSGTAASVGSPPKDDMINVGSGSFFAGKKTWVSIAEGDSDPPEVVATPPSLDRKVPVYPVTEIEKAITDMKDGRLIKPIAKF